MSERVLVCILAEIRAHELTWNNFRRNVIEELSADLAVCIGITDHFDYSNPYYEHAKFRWTIPEFDDWGEAFDLAKRYLGSRADWRCVLRVRDQWLGGIKGPEAQPGSAAILLFFRWLLKQKIVENDLISIYDRFIVTRSDFYYWCPHPPMGILTPKYIWIPFGEDYGGFTDRHLVVSAADVTLCLNLLSDVIREPKRLYREMRRFKAWNLERYIRYQFSRAGLERRVRRFPYIMTTVRGEKDGTRWAAGKFDPTVGMIIKYQSEMRAASQYRTLIKTGEDWHRVYETTRFAHLVSPPADFKAVLEEPWVTRIGKSAWTSLRRVMRWGLRRIKESCPASQDR